MNEEKLKAFHSTLLQSEGLTGIPTDFAKFKAVFDDPEKSKGFHQALTSAKSLKGIPTDYNKFRSAFEKKTLGQDELDSASLSVPGESSLGSQETSVNPSLSDFTFLESYGNLLKPKDQDKSANLLNPRTFNEDGEPVETTSSPESLIPETETDPWGPTAFASDAVSLEDSKEVIQDRTELIEKHKDPKLAEIAKKPDLSEEDMEVLRGFMKTEEEVFQSDAEDVNETEARAILSGHLQSEKVALEALQSRTKETIAIAEQEIEEFQTQAKEYELAGDIEKANEFIGLYNKKSAVIQDLITDYNAGVIVSQKKIQNLDEEVKAQYDSSTETFLKSAANELQRLPQYTSRAISDMLAISSKSGVSLGAEHLVIGHFGDQLHSMLEVENELFPVDQREERETARLLGTATGQMASMVAAGAVTGGTVMAPMIIGYGMGSDAMYREAVNAGIDKETAKELGMTVGAFTMGLEAIGIGGLTRKLVARNLRKEVIDYTLSKGVKEIGRDISKGQIKASTAKFAWDYIQETSKGGAREWITEGLEQIAFDGVQRFHNETKAPKKFEDMPELFGEEYWDNYIENANAGGVAGLFLNGAVNLNTIRPKSREAYFLARDFSIDPQTYDQINTEIDNKLKRGKITEKQASDSRAKITAMRETFDSIPDDLPDGRRSKIYELLYDKKVSENAAKDKDEVFVKKAKKDAEEIDKQIEALIADDYGWSEQDHAVFEKLGNEDTQEQFIAIKKEAEIIEDKINSGQFKGKKLVDLKKLRAFYATQDMRLKEELGIEAPKPVAVEERKKKGVVVNSENINHLEDADYNNTGFLEGSKRIQNRKFNRGVRNAVANIPGLNVEVFNSREELAEAMSEIEGKYQSANAAFDPRTNTILISPESARDNSLYHEVTHALSAKMESSNPEQFHKLAEGVNLASMPQRKQEGDGSDTGKEVSYFQWAKDNYGQLDENGEVLNMPTVLNEAFSEMQGDIAAHKISNPSLVEKYTEMLKDFLTSIGLGKIVDSLEARGQSVTDIDISQFDNLNDLMETTGQALRRGDKINVVGEVEQTAEEGLKQQKDTTIKGGVDLVFKENPELTQIGTQEQYSQYLNTIFPESKTKDILYHGGAIKKDDSFERTKLFPHFFFTSNRIYANRYAKTRGGNLHSVLLNTSNLTEGTLETSNSSSEMESIANSGFDGVHIPDNDPLIKEYNFDEYIVFEPEQIHILGSNKDVDGFRDFIDQGGLKMQKDTSKLKEHFDIVEDSNKERSKHLKEATGQTPSKKIIGLAKKAKKELIDRRANVRENLHKVAEKAKLEVVLNDHLIELEEAQSRGAKAAEISSIESKIERVQKKIGKYGEVKTELGKAVSKAVADAEKIKADLAVTKAGVMMDLSAGASGQAKHFTDQAFAEIWGGVRNGLTKKKYNLLSNIITHTRNVEIAKAYKDKYAEGEAMVAEGDKTGQDIMKKYDPAAFKLEMGLTAEQSENWLKYLEINDPETFTALNARADKYFDKQKELVDRMAEEGIFTEEQHQELVRFKYSPRLYVDRMLDADTRGESPNKTGGSGDTGVRGLKGGSEAFLFNDPEYLLNQAAKSAFKKIYENRALKALGELAESVPDNDLVQEMVPVQVDKFGQNVYGEPEMGKTRLEYFRDGKKQAVVMDNQDAIEFMDDDKKHQSPEWANFLSTISGTKALKAMATGHNPLFAISNMMRDFQFALLTTDHYSLFQPLATAQLTGDLVKAMSKMAVNRGANLVVDSRLAKKLGINEKAQEIASKDSDYVKAIEQGLMMNFLTTQGIIEAGRTKNKVAKSAWDAVKDFTSMFGEFSEISMRLAIRDRVLKNQQREFEKNNTKPTESEKRDMEFMATHAARTYLDFHQGGNAVKAADSVFPYLNASAQALRKGVEYGYKHPVKFSMKILQFGAGIAGLYGYNTMVDAEEYDRIPPWDKEKNYIIMNPMGKHPSGRRDYWKIPKTHEIFGFATFFESLLDKSRGIKTPMEVVKSSGKSFMQTLPINKWNDLIPAPVVQALYAYYANYDTFLERDVFHMEPGEIEPEAEFTSKTPASWIALGDVTGRSPERLRVAVSKVITMPKNNLFLNFGEQLANMVVGGEEAVDDDVAATLLKRFEGTTRVSGNTNSDKSDKIVRKHATENKLMNDKVRELYNKFAEGENIEAEYRKIFETLPEYEQERMNRRFMDMVKNQDVSNDALEIKYTQNPEAAAELYVEHTKGMSQEEQFAFDQELVKSGWSMSERFENEYRRLKGL